MYTKSSEKVLKQIFIYRYVYGKNYKMHSIVKKKTNSLVLYSQLTILLCKFGDNYTSLVHDTMCSNVTKLQEPLFSTKLYYNAKVNILIKKQNTHMQFSNYVEFAKIHSS